MTRKTTRAARRPRKPKPKKKPLTARNADRHDLYQRAVQDVESEAVFLARTFKKLRGRNAISLREDFCGTALLCGEWVKKKGRTAVGLDLDREVLAWGEEHHLKAMGEPGNRVTLRRQDVRAPCPGRFDVSVALNFSYFVFKTRADMVGYFRSVRRSMAKDGLFFLDLYGGYESWEPMEEPRRLPGFTYVWDQDKVNPVTNEVMNYIHFHFPGGSKMRKAFTYDWRLWTLPEVRELLLEAGFSKSTVYWEDGDEDGEGTGVFRPRAGVGQEAAWVAYVVAAP